jgi:hypothetical protein
MRNIKAACSLGLTCLSIGGWGMALADAPAGYLSTGRASPVAVYRTAATPRPDNVEGLGARVDSGVLAGLSGGTDVSASISLNGTVSDNHADHVITGYNTISAGSFQGAAGVPMVIQNTGNNVLIQNATIINVQFRP